MKLILSFFLMFFMSESCFSGQIHVNLHSRVAIDRIDVRLGDIADVTANDDSDMSRLLQVSVAKMKSLAVLEKLTREQILVNLVSQLPELQEDIVWGSNESVLIEGKKHHVSIDSGADVAASWIIEHMAEFLGEIECSLINSPKLIEIPIGSMKQQPDLKKARWTRNVVSIPLNISVDGVVVAKRVLNFKVRKVSPVIVGTSRPVMRDQTLASMPSSSLSREHKHMASYTEVQRDMLITKNQHVRVRIQSGEISIESEGTALSNAYAGDMVAVKRADSQSVVVGLAAAPNLVVIED